MSNHHKSKCSGYRGGWTYLVGNSLYADGIFPQISSFSGYQPLYNNGTFRADQGLVSNGVCFGPATAIDFDIKFQITKISFNATFDWYNSQPGYGYISNYNGLSTNYSSWNNLYNSFGAMNSSVQKIDIVLNQASSRTRITFNSTSCQRMNLPNYLFIEYLKVK